MADATLGPGTVLAGRFRLEDLLDENDGARFWRATDQVLSRSVSVHVLPDTDPRADALLEAARSSALVSDLRLLRVLDAASTDGLVYVVHEWGSGVSVDRLVAEAALSPRRAAWVVKEVAEAVTAAHRGGVAHGRLIPENVMISESGSVKLIGFAVDAAVRSPHGPRLAADGTPVSAARSDVLNLAALLYAALVGRWPGTEGSTMSLAPTEHGHPLRPRRVRAGVPRPLDAICERVLNPDLHPTSTPVETAQEIAAALSDFIGDPGGSSSLTAVLETPAADHGAAGDPPGGEDEDTGEDTGEDTVATGDLAATGAMSAADLPVQRPAATGDPEATQAGVPMLDDAGRLAPSVPAESPAPTVPVRRAAPPPDLAPVHERPLFADGPARPGPRSVGADRGTDGSPDASPDGSPDGGTDAGTEGSGSFLASRIGSSTAATAGATAAPRSTGAGNGPLPSTWGPDADEAPAVGSGWRGGDRDPAPGRRWLGVAVALGVVVVLVAATVLVLNLGRGGAGQAAPATPSTSTSASSAAPRSWPIADVRDFDPEGSPPTENPQLTPLAHDGDPSTAWTTLTYRGNPRLGGLKSGVGLLVDLGRPRPVGEVRLRLVGRPTAVRALAAPGAATAPASTAGLRTLAGNDAAGTDVTLAARSAVTTRWVVVWLTSLPAVAGGYEGQVAEVTVRS